MVSSSPRRTRAVAPLRDWPWMRLPALLWVYVTAVPVVALVTIGIVASGTAWHQADLGKFFLLLGCGLTSVAATPRMAYNHSGISRDFLTVWVLPVAILLPPFYALVTPIPLLILTQWYVHRGVVYRRVFTAAAIGLSYGAASYAFRAFPGSFAGGTVQTGMHALTWAVAVAACELVGWLGHHILIVGAIKITDPTAGVADLVWSREALQGDLVQIDLGVLITVVLAVDPLLAIIAVPTVLLVRRFLVHTQLVAQSRIDAKTGLLNVSTWEREATAELSRAMRTRSPVSLALIDIDHFKSVNDTHGHLVGDRVLRAVSDALTAQLRDYDRAGRFGGEEFVVLLPQTAESDAHRIAERLRLHMAGLAVPVDDRPEAPCVRLTISIGVSATDGSAGELTDLLASADAALYYAKQAGRNRTHVFSSASTPLTVPPQASAVHHNGHTTVKPAGRAGLARPGRRRRPNCPASP
jgi:diguanylate cyclase (GGDEF)-like protein